MRMCVPPYEEQKGVWTPGLDRRTPAGKAHAREMNRMLACRRPTILIADCPILQEDSVRESIRTSGTDAVRDEQQKLYDSANNIFFYGGSACSISSMFRTQEDLAQLFQSMKDLGVTPTKTEQVVNMMFYTVYAHRGVSQAVDMHFDIMWDKYLVLNP